MESSSKNVQLSFKDLDGVKDDDDLSMENRNKFTSPVRTLIMAEDNLNQSQTMQQRRLEFVGSNIEGGLQYQ